MSDAAPDDPVPMVGLRRCPGCGNRVTRQTPLCPVCGKHAVTARVASAVRWSVIVGGAAALAWWSMHR